MTVRLRWLGCAAWRIEHDGQALLVDPWISRNPWARPPFIAPPDALFPASAALVGHGHFDHAADLPDLTRTRDLPIFTEVGTARRLEKNGVRSALLRPMTAGWRGHVGPFALQAHPIKHVFYGFPLLFRTLFRIGWRAPRYLPLALHWPCGQALAWRIDVGGRSILHMGTAGATRDELETIAAAGPTDVLLIALQGNDRIHEISAAIVDHLKPRLVIPHHQDDFYPPISAQIPVAPFADLVARQTPGSPVHELQCGETLELEPQTLNNRSSGA